MTDLATALAPLADVGLDRWGVADAAGWLPPGVEGSRLVVIGSTPAPLWAAFRTWILDEPGRARLPHPFDAYVEAQVRKVDLGPGRWVICGEQSEVHLDFRGLAIAAGLGHASRLGIVIHDVVGPWLGLRAAFVTETPFAVTPPTSGASPCTRCAAPCQRACPADALASGSWDAERCLPSRVRRTLCAGGCLSRLACPVGATHRPAPETLDYHQTPARRAKILGDWT
ncbi:MAG: hypothetical protein RLZZ383_394 [Pseudomonadota bacterium]|jgi:ferredoxin